MVPVFREFPFEEEDRKSLQFPETSLRVRQELWCTTEAGTLGSQGNPQRDRAI